MKRWVILAIVMAIGLAGCETNPSQVMAGRTSVGDATEQQLRAEYSTGVLEGCWAAYKYSYAQVGKEMTVGDIRFVGDVCLEIAQDSLKTWQPVE